MYVEKNQNPIGIIEWFLQSALFSILIATSQYISTLSIQNFACALISAMGVFIFYWLKLSDNGNLALDKRTNTKFIRLIILFAVPGIVIGLLTELYIFCAAFGVFLACITLLLGLIPYRKEVWLSTHNLDHWSIEQLEIALKDIGEPANRDERLRVHYIKEELDKRKISS